MTLEKQMSLECRQEMSVTYEKNMVQKARRIVVFASFSSNGKISDYVVYYLQELHKVADTIVFIADNTVFPAELKKIEPIIVHAECINHGSYDFGSYKRGFVWVEQNHLLDEAEELVFCNDSCYGPVYPLKPIFDSMWEKKDIDFWGLVDSHESHHHILSFFLAFKRPVFLSPVFCNFVHSFRKLESFWDYVNCYEKHFTETLEKEGFRAGTYVKLDKDVLLSCVNRAGNGNLMLSPLTIHQAGMPLIKVKSLNTVYGKDMNESPILLLNEIKNTNKTLYDIIINDLNSKGIVQEDKWLLPSDIVSKAEIVSFDVFDTLLARPFKQPTDLFRLMEEELGVSGFAKERVAAEARARKRHPEQADVTLSQIYESIGSEYKSLMNDELRYEADLLFVKADGRAIYEEALRQKKHIIAVSDMYLPGSFISDVLKKKGYGEISEVYVSNEENCCKGDGRLFKAVLEHLNISPSEMVHIGDNPVSDKEAPMKLGIKAVLRKSDYTTLMDIPSLAKLQCFSFREELSVSILSGLFARHIAENKLKDSYYELGYIYGGPLAVGYAQHINKIAKENNIDGLLFVSRDGYAVKEIYQKFYGDNVPSSYIQMSRLLTLRNSVDYELEIYKKTVFEIFSKERLKGERYSEELFEKYTDELHEWAKQNKSQYDEYVKNLHIHGKRLMSIDMTTREHTSLKVLKKMFGDRLYCGMFSITFGEACDYCVMSYANRHWKAGDEPILMLQEELITAPECSAYRINDDGTFSYADWNITERTKAENYKKILAGIRDFADDFMKLSAGHTVSISFEDWWNLADNYMKYAHFGDFELLKRIYHDDAISGTFDSLYNIYNHQAQNNNTEPADVHAINLLNDLRKLEHKNRKHLNIVRILGWILGIETLIFCLYLFLT